MVPLEKDRKKMRFNARAFGAAFGLVLIGAMAHATVSPFWGGSVGNGPAAVPGQQPTVNGPWGGDFVFNIYQLVRAHVTMSGISYSSLSVSQTVGQANCTALSTDGTFEIKTSAGTGYICLNSALAGKVVHIGNATGNTIDIYPSNTPAIAGGADTINGSTGAYTGLSGTNHEAVCVSPNNGAWYCMSGT